METTPITIAARRLPGYKYLIHSALMIISHSSFFCLGFLSPALNLLAMEDKRGTKCPCSPSTEGSPSPSDVETPPSAPSGFPPPPGSPSKISLCRPRSPVFEQGGPSGNIVVIDLSSSSDEEDFFADTSRDVEFARRLFGDLNCDLLRPPGDGKVIVLSNSDEEEEAHEETTTDADATSSTIVKSSTLVASTANADEDRGKMQDNNSDDLAPGQDTGKRVAAETKSARLRLPHQERCLRQACFKESYIQRCYSTSSFVQRSWDGDTES
jgi:hypothetical protein